MKQRQVEESSSDNDDNDHDRNIDGDSVDALANDNGNDKHKGKGKESTGHLNAVRAKTAVVDFSDSDSEHQGSRDDTSRQAVDPCSTPATLPTRKKYSLGNLSITPPRPKTQDMDVETMASPLVSKGVPKKDAPEGTDAPAPAVSAAEENILSSALEEIVTGTSDDMANNTSVATEDAPKDTTTSVAASPSKMDIFSDSDKEETGSQLRVGLPRLRSLIG